MEVILIAPDPKLLLLAFCLVSSNLLSQAGEGKEPPVHKAPARSPAGQRSFASRCAGCHGLDGRGSDKAPNIATNPKVQGKSNAELLRTISGGMPDFGMPAFRLLGQAEIKNILDYLRTLQGRRTDAAVPGDPRNGRTLFFGAASCSTCHRAQGEGGFSATDLSTYGEGKLAIEIRAAITSPGSNPPGRARTATAVTHDGVRLAGAIRNEDNFSVQLQSDDGALHFLLKSDLANLDYQPPPPMPADYKTKLSAKELDDLVSYLHSLKSAEDSGPEGEDSQ